MRHNNQCSVQARWRSVEMNCLSRIYKPGSSLAHSSLTHNTPYYYYHSTYSKLIMSEAGRQSFTDKAGAALKPDSQKTATEQLSDTVKGNLDSAASTLQPNESKSDSQKVGDTLSGNSNENKDSLFQQAKNAVGLGDSNPKH
ncbi:unnamed protein product [Rhizoctonia solani]|uniref:Uncharacterized protein n=1 Tax=Rhizoctonia solani TaxID=456999 RepID=A0A8H3BXN6_9AGAM|nr:unnamed protein product [Rhizoctonia solani]